MLVERGYLKSVRIMECPSAKNSYAVKVLSSYYVYDTTKYKKTPADGSTVVWASYLVKPTKLLRDKTFMEAWNTLKNHPEKWPYRVGKHPEDTLACDLIKGNYFSHTEGINVLFEDGSVEWLNGIPERVASNWSSYTLWNGDRRMLFFRWISRGEVWNR